MTLISMAYSYEMNLDKVDYNFYRDLSRAHASPLSVVIEKDLLSRELFSENSIAIEVSNNPQLQVYIDEVFLEMFSTEMGQSICLAISVDANNIKNSLGVGRDTSIKISKICAEALKKMDSQAIEKGVSKFSPKNYVFVLNSKQKRPFESWTSMFNVTYIFVDKVMTRLNFFKSIIHEFYVSYDAKFLFGKGTANIYFNDYFKLTTTNLFNAGLESALDQIAGIYPYPILKNSFLVIRATIFETWVIHEFQKHRNELKDAKIYEYLTKFDTHCEDILEQTMEELLEYQVDLLPFEYSILSENEKIELAKFNGIIVNEKGPKIFSDLFRKSKLRVKDNIKKRKLSICQFLIFPQIGNLSTFYTRGPRPRIKTGWSGSGDKKIGDIDLSEVFIDQNFEDKELELEKFIKIKTNKSNIYIKDNKIFENHIENLYKTDEE